MTVLALKDDPMPTAAATAYQTALQLSVMVVSDLRMIAEGHGTQAMCDDVIGSLEVMLNDAKRAARDFK
jgi:hypothetical protein